LIEKGRKCGMMEDSAFKCDPIDVEHFVDGSKIGRHDWHKKYHGNGIEVIRNDVLEGDIVDE
jgi:hypothetical protein